MGLLNDLKKLFIIYYYLEFIFILQEGIQYQVSVIFLG